MAIVELDGKSYEVDEEGYLVDLSTWDEKIAIKMAELDDAA